MPGFDHIDTAAAVREIIMDAAKQQVDINAPTPNYGRVISVNVPALQATVWFPGDDAPVSVNMFANNVPAAWQEQSSNGTNTSFIGYGSQVAVADFNGKKYITQVLTGSILYADSQLFTPNIVTQVATEVAADKAGFPKQLVGVPHETFINCHVSDATLGDGGAISFGPFTNLDKALPISGWIEVTVTELTGAIKYFKFVVNPIGDMYNASGAGILDHWLRVLPENQITDNPGNAVASIDFDFDIAVKRTLYGIVDDFIANNELWMRIVKRGTGWSGLNCKITIRSTSIQKGRSLSGRQLFMQETLASPPAHKGFLGFHNAQHVYRDFDDYGVLDAFGRTIPSNSSNSIAWGISDSGPSWLGNTGGPWGVNGSAAYIAPTGNYISYMTLNSTNTYNPDMYWDTWIDAMPTGAEVQSAMMARFTGSSNTILLKVVFNTSGQITLSIVTIVSGTATTIGTDYNPGVTFTANQRIRCRGRLYGTSMFIKCWNPATQREPDWVKFEGGAPFSTNPAHVTGFMVQPGAANTNTKPIRVYFDNVRASLYTKGQDNSGSQWHTGPWRSGLLRIADSLQKTWICQGQIYWDRTNGLRWSGSIRMTGIGQHRNGLAAGLAMLQSPPASWTIPVVPNGGTVTTSAGGSIPLAVGQALWCAIPPGQTWENLYEYLFITSATATTDYDLPEWCILIAVRNPDLNSGPDLRLGNGMHLDAWRPISFQNGWAAATGTGSGPIPAYRLKDPNHLQLVGRMVPGTKADGTLIFTLPVFFAPASQMGVGVNCNNQVLANSPHLEIDQNLVYCWGLTGATIVTMDAEIPLDAP